MLSTSEPILKLIQKLGRGDGKEPQASGPCGRKRDESESGSATEADRIVVLRWGNQA